MTAYCRLFGTICCLFSLVIGCSPSKSTSPGQSPQPQKTSFIQRVKQTTPSNKYSKSGQAYANRLEQIAERRSHVRGATAVTLGKYAIVGLDLDPNLDRGQVGTVKYSVAEAIKNDARGNRTGTNAGSGGNKWGNVLVTADTDLVQRLKNVRKDIIQGRPISGIMKELAAIAERVTPQPTPTQINPPRRTS